MKNCEFINSPVSVSATGYQFSLDSILFQSQPVYLDGNTLNISNCVFKNIITERPLSLGAGGAIAIENYFDETTIQVSSCDFNSNSADKGAVLYCILNPYGNSVNPSFDSCTMEDNHSSTEKILFIAIHPVILVILESFGLESRFACIAGVAVIVIVIVVIILKKRKKTQTYDPIN